MQTVSLVYATHIQSIYNVYTKLILLGILVYAYAFINLDTRAAYYMLFTRIFEVLANASRQTLRFCYLHHTNRGIRSIGLDMCMKQAGGKYMYHICIAYANNMQDLVIIYTT